MLQQLDFDTLSCSFDYPLFSRYGLHVQLSVKYLKGKHDHGYH